MPDWAVDHITRYNIREVFGENGKRKDILKASKAEIHGEVFVRSYLAWVAERAGREDLLNAVKSGKYISMLKEFQEADKMALSRAVREMVSRATMPNEEEVRQAIQTYWKILSDPKLAKHVRDTLELGKVELPEDIVRKYGIRGDYRRALELIREAMIRGSLWTPPGWRIRPNNPIRPR